ncbi:MAG: hypothetical protein PVJ92_01535 [Candidatus Dependentiae bacterium]
MQPLERTYNDIINNIDDLALRDDLSAMFMPFFSNKMTPEYAEQLRIFAEHLQADEAIDEVHRAAIHDLTVAVLTALAEEQPTGWASLSPLTKGVVIGGSALTAAALLGVAIMLLRSRITRMFSPSRTEEEEAELRAANIATAIELADISRAEQIAPYNERQVALRKREVQEQNAFDLLRQAMKRRDERNTRRREEAFAAFQAERAREQEAREAAAAAKAARKACEEQEAAEQRRREAEASLAPAPAPVAAPVPSTISSRYRLRSGAAGCYCNCRGELRASISAANQAKQYQI